MKIVCDDKIPYIRGVFEKFAEVRYLPGNQISAADVADADALIVRTRTKCNAALLRGSSVKIVATATIGFDHIATGELAGLGIKWCNAPGCNADSVKNYISSALASLQCDLSDKVMGIVGVGHVGKRVAVAARALGMKVLLNDPPRADAEGKEGFVELDELLQTSDIVTVHVPLEKSGPYPTLNMADGKFFSMMKKGSCFFNSCRGEIVVPQALKDALAGGIVSAALLDVWPQEPELDSELVKLVRFGTPHIAGYSKDGKANGTSAAVRNTARALGIGELYDFQVSELPEPVFAPDIYPDTSLPLWQQLNFAILHAYDITKDVQELYADTNQFEALRGNYWNRREFSAYTVHNISSPEAAERFAALGFKTA